MQVDSSLETVRSIAMPVPEKQMPGFRIHPTTWSKFKVGLTPVRLYSFPEENQLTEHNIDCALVDPKRRK
jgi:hypothetical protein